MNDAFALYGAEAAPVISDKRPNRRAKAPSKLDLKLEERQRLTRAYKAARRLDRIAILKEEPRLLDFMRYLRRVGPEDGDELLEALASCDWLLRSSQRIRGFALSRIASRTDKIRLSIGLKPFDDPLPPETSVFLEARRILADWGPL